MNAHLVAIRNISKNIFVSKSIDAVSDIIVEEFSENYSGNIRIHMTDTLKSDIHFGDCYHDIKNPATEKNIFPWHTRSTIDITHNNISFSAIKNDLTAISNEDRTCINAILLICEKHLANHPLKCVSDIVQFNKNHASLKIADRLDESLSTLQKDFSRLDECVRSLQAGSINLPNVKENISHFYKTYNDFEKFRDVVKNLSDASVIELMKIQKI